MKTKMRILISGILILLIVLALTVSATSSGEVTFSTSTFSTLADFNTTAVTLGSVWASRGTVSLDEYVDDIDAVKLTYTQESTQWLNHFVQSTIPSVTSTYQSLYNNGSRGIYFYVHNDTGLSMKVYPHFLNQNGSVTWVSLVKNTNAYLIADDNLKFSKTAVIDGEGIKVPADFRGYLVFPFTSMGNGTESIVDEGVMDDIFAGKFGFYSRTLSNVEPAADKNFYIFNYGTYKPNALSTNFTTFANFNTANWSTGQLTSWPGTPSVNGYMEEVVYNSNKTLRLTFGTYGNTKLCQFATIDAFTTIYGNNTIEQASPSSKTGFYIKVANNSSKIINYSVKFLDNGIWYTNTVGSNLLLYSSADLANPIVAPVVLGLGVAIPANFAGYIVVPYNTISASNDAITSTLPTSGYVVDDMLQRSFGGIFNAGNVTFASGEYVYILDYGAYKPTPPGPTPIQYNVSRPQLGTIPTLNKSQAQSVAANILSAPKPAIGDTQLDSLSLPEGYSETIYTTDYEDIIDTDGTITPPDNFTLAKVVYEITKQGDSEKGYTSVLKVLIPARKRIIDSDFSSSLSNLRYGLMIHMSANNNTVDLGCGYVGPNGENLGGISNYTNIYNLTPIIDDLVAMNFEYICITDFHGLGVTLHPSAALDFYRGEGVYSSKRDFLGELINGLKNKGIKVMLLTHPLDGHDYPIEERTALGWYDSSNNYKRWNDFICDVYADIVSRYGSDLIGISFDSEFGLSENEEWTGKLDVIRLRDAIRSYSNLPLISLVPPNQLTGYSLREVWRPSWLDPWMSRSENIYDVEDWPAYYRAPAVVTTNHWGTISTRQNSSMYLTGIQLYRYMALQACVSTDGPGVMWGTSPYYNGQWEIGVREAFLDVGARISLLKESLQKVAPSKSYIRREGIKLSTLPNGIAATSSLDGKYEYIHVLNHPIGSVLTLPAPADGKRFSSACTLNPSHAVDLSQASDGTVTLTLQSEEEWDEVDTVIRLTNTNVDSKNLALFKPVLYSSSVESTDFSNIGWGNIRAVDGNTTYVPQTESWSFPLYGWSSNGRSSQLSNGESEWITIDLKSSYLVNNVMLYPRSDTGNENLGFPTNFTIKTSLDNVNWTTSLAKTNYPKPNGSAIFTFNTVNARYIKVEATELTRVPKISGNYFFQLGEIEIYYNPDSINATGVKLNKSNISITVISTETLIATVIPTNSINQNVSWTSSNPNVSTVSENGVVTAVSIGTANITAITADGGFVANCVVSVTPVTQELFLSSNLNNDDSQNWEFKGVPGNGSWFYIRNISSNLYLSYIGGQCVISAFTGGAEQYFSCDKLGGNMSLVNLLNQGEGLSNLSGQLTMSEAYPTITFSTPFINFFPLNSVNFGNVPNGTILYVGTISFKEAEINYYLTYGEKPPVDFGKYIVNLNKTRISNIQPNSSINDFLAFVNVRSDTDLVFSNISPNNIINTGTTIDIMVNGVLTDTYTIVIYGDVDGNGIINITDLAAIKAHLLDIFVLSGANLEAGDIFTTGSISISDLVAIKKHLLAIQFITQKYE